MADLSFDVDTALSEVPVNLMPLTDATDFRTKEEAVAYDAAGMDLVWNFTTTTGVTTQTPVTPTSGGSYDWTHQGNAMYTIEIPASGGVSINNNAEGVGWFTGEATGVLPWRSPVFVFRAAAINNALVNDASITVGNVTGDVGGDVIGNVGGIAGTNYTTLDALATHGDLVWASLVSPESGTARTAGSPTASQIQLDTDASTIDDYYNGSLVFLTSGTGAYQLRRIINYTGGTRMADLDAAWAESPDATSDYELIPDRGVTQAQVEAAVAAALATYDPPTNAEMVARTLAAASYATAASQTTIEGKIDTVNSNVDTVNTATASTETKVDTLTTNLATTDGVVNSILALLNDAAAEPASVPAANASRAAKLDFLYTYFRNAREQTADTYTHLDDNGNPLFTKTFSNDGTTAVSGKATDIP